MGQCGMFVPNFYFPFLVLWTEGFYQIYMKICRNVSWVGGKSPFEFMIFGECFIFYFCIPSSLCTEMRCGIDWSENCPVTEPVCLYTSEVKTPGLTGLHTDTLCEGEVLGWY